MNEAWKTLKEKMEALGRMEDGFPAPGLIPARCKTLADEALAAFRAYQKREDVDLTAAYMAGYQRGLDDGIALVAKDEG